MPHGSGTAIPAPLWRIYLLSVTTLPACASRPTWRAPCSRTPPPPWRACAKTACCGCWNARRPPEKPPMRCWDSRCGYAAGPHSAARLAWSGIFATRAQPASWRRPPTCSTTLSAKPSAAWKCFEAATMRETDTLILGAVAYDSKVVTIWEGLRAYFADSGLSLDYVLFSNYERQVRAFFDG